MVIISKIILRNVFFTVSILIGFDMQAQINNSAEIKTVQLPENGHFPNNTNLPVLLYKNVFEFAEGDPASTIEKVLAGNSWTFHSLLE